MDRNLKRRSELTSALVIANKTFDLKRKKLLSSALDATNDMVNDSMEHCLPQRLDGANRTKRIGFPSTKMFSHSNISSVQARQAATQENLGHQVIPPRTEPYLNEDTRMEARESTEEMFDTASDVNNVNVKSRRGSTKGLNTQKYTKMTGEKPKIIIPEDINRPVGSHSSKHASMIGVLIKLEAPMQVEGWGKISEDKKEDLFLKLTNKLDYEVDKPHVIRCIWKSFAKQYATFRSKAHSYYEKMKAKGGMALAKKSLYDKLATRPDDWLWLCNFWESENFKKISKIQSQNRAKLKHKHKLGTKSRAAHQFEKNLDDVDMYEAEFYNSKNGWADQEVEANSARMKELRKQQEELPDDTSCMTAEQICIAVLGENSAYAKSKGLNPKRLRGNDASSFEAFRNRIQVDEELAATKIELADTKTELADTKTALAAQQATMANMIKCLEKITGQSMSEILEIDS